MTREEAIEHAKTLTWPDVIDHHVSGRVFGNWRWVDTGDEVLLANCIEPGIRREECQMQL